MGAAIYVAMDMASWRSCECRKDYFFGKHFRRGPVKTFSKGKYLCDVIHAQSSILYLSEGQNSGCQMSGSVIHYLQGEAFDSMVLHKNLVQSGFYTSQKV